MSSRPPGTGPPCSRPAPPNCTCTTPVWHRRLGSTCSKRRSTSSGPPTPPGRALPRHPSRRSPPMTELTQRLGDRPIVAVLRASESTAFLPVCDVLFDEGFPAVEITMTTPGALQVIADIRRRMPSDAVVGAGTVRTLAQVDGAIDAGAQFLVSQITSPELVAAAAARGVPFIPGALTPTEIVHAWQLGVEAVKVSPVGPIGGLDYLAELIGPLPEIALFPTGGVLISQAADYLDTGASIIGLSRDLVRDAFNDGSLDELRERARFVVDSVAARRTAQPA
ncbi:2-dehydro-3-deoxyphosphogluconate aldolase [Rathayibacter sp. AY2B7]|nr:2-dehydro-3-deoxyphosphogluconate aldolase [Rathayibacter sp. AY2B7]